MSFHELEREANMGSQIKVRKRKGMRGEGVSSQWEEYLKAAYL